MHKVTGSCPSLAVCQRRDFSLLVVERIGGMLDAGKRPIVARSSSRVLPLWRVFMRKVTRFAQSMMDNGTFLSTPSTSIHIADTHVAMGFRVPGGRSMGAWSWNAQFQRSLPIWDTRVCTPKASFHAYTWYTVHLIGRKHLLQAPS